MFNAKAGQWSAGHSVPSLVPAIDSLIKRHTIDTGFLVADGTNIDSDPLKTTTAKRAAALLRSLSPKCREPGLVKEAGCLPCTHWRWSRCS